MVGFERGQVLFFDCAWNFDETACRSTKFLIRSQVPDIIQLRIEASLRDRLYWCDLQGVGRSA